MRGSLRIGAAALLTVSLLFLLGRLSNVAPQVPRPQARWIFNVGSRPDLSELNSWRSRWSKSESGVAPKTYDTTPITVPNDRIIVMAKLAVEDTNWVGAELAEYVAIPFFLLFFFYLPNRTDNYLNLGGGASSTRSTIKTRRDTLP